MAKTIFVNSRIFSYDAETSQAELRDTLITEGERIAYVGRAADEPVQAAKREGAKVVDLADRVVVPGFIDSHVHLLLFGLSLEKLDLSGCRSLEDIRQTISQYAKSHPSPLRIVCRGWHQPSSGGKALASMLDDLDDRPIYVEALDLHSTWCSSSALAELPLDVIKAVCGDDVQCDEDGNPTGLLAESAQVGFVWPYLARTSTVDEKQAALKRAFDAYVEAGYTGVIDMLMDDHSWEALQLYRERNGGLPIHIAAHWYVPFEQDTDSLLQGVDEAIAMHKKWHPSVSPDFCVIGIKLIADGVVDGCTAALSHPYGGRSNIVEPQWPADAMNLAVKRAADAGLQCAIHALGDAAITQSINAIAAANQPHGRHRIEHLELATKEDAKRLGQLGITASIQPVHSDPELVKAYLSHIGQDSWERAFPYREFVDGNACIAIGTDAPTARHLPLPNLYNATTRKSALNPLLSAQTNPHNALSLTAAVAAATTGAAYSRFAEGWTGTLREGLRADFVVLDTAWMPEKLLESKVYQTWSKGEKLFEA